MATMSLRECAKQDADKKGAIHEWKEKNAMRAIRAKRNQRKNHVERDMRSRKANGEK